MHGCAVAAALISLVLCGASGSVSAADNVRTELPGGNFMQTETFLGIAKWRLLPHLWTEKTVIVSCPSISEFSVYTANTAAQLADAVVRKHSAWCGFSSTMSWDASTCVVSLSPFRETSVAVVHPSEFSYCTFEEQEHFAMYRVVMGLMGIIFFMFAETLVNSLTFRLGAGTTLFVMLSAVILTFIVYRSLPNKKSLAATVTLFGTTMASITKYLVGHWLPSLHDILYNKVLAGYVALSALVGLAVTYYYDDPDNRKLNVILQRGLQLGGAALVFSSPSLPEAGAVAVALMAAAYAVRGSAHWLRIFGGKERLVKGADGAHGKLASEGLANLNMFPSIIERNGRRRYGEPSHSDLAESSWTDLSTGGSDSVRSGTRSQSQPRYSHCSGLVSGSDTSEESLVLSSREPSAVSRSMSHMSSGLPRRHSQQLSAPSAPISPLVQRGLIFNEASGRTIQVGKPTYKRLVSSGYQVDEEHGTLTPPGRVSSGGAKRKPATSAQTAPAARGYGLPAAAGSVDVSVAHPAISAAHVTDSKMRGR